MHIQSVERNASCLQGRSLASWREEFDARGFVIFEKVLGSEHVIALRRHDVAVRDVTWLELHDCDTEDLTRSMRAAARVK
jgi:hypothetical protein